MAYAEGGSLAPARGRAGAPGRSRCDFVTDIAAALAFVHAKGIRHCDLKPGNVLLNQHGQPLIADFGQAHLSDDAAPALGTFFYMAPEQADRACKSPTPAGTCTASGRSSTPCSPASRRARTPL